MDKINSKIADLEEQIGGLHARGTGDGGAEWGRWLPGGGGLTVEGEETLYYGIFLRAYDPETGALRAIGEELEGDDLKPTWDVLRAT